MNKKIIFSEQAIHKDVRKEALARLKSKITVKNLQEVEMGEFLDEIRITFRIRR